MKSHFWQLIERSDGKWTLIFCDERIVLNTKEEALLRLVFEMDRLLLTVLHDADESYDIGCGNLT